MASQKLLDINKPRIDKEKQEQSLKDCINDAFNEAKMLMARRASELQVLPMNIYPTITTGENWRDKFREIEYLRIEKMLFFLTMIEKHRQKKSLPINRGITY
jgi:hypothetical protein